MLYYRAIEEADLPRLRDFRNALMPNFRQFRLLNMINQRDWLARVSRYGDGSPGEHIMIGVTEVKAGIADAVDLIGVIGLTYIDWVNRNAEASIYIGPPGLAGKGYGKEALKFLCNYGFADLCLHRIYAEIFDFNAASIALFESCGFVREGVLRQAQYHAGSWRDVFVYGLLAGEAER